MAWTSCYRIQQIILLLTCIPLIRAEFLVNAKTQLGNVVRQSITEDISDNSIRLEFVDWDLTKITQVVDFKSGFSIFRAVLYGEVDLGQPTSQILCFVNNLGPKDFIEADSVSKLRQVSFSHVLSIGQHIILSFACVSMCPQYIYLTTSIVSTFEHHRNFMVLFLSTEKPRGHTHQ